jgi:alpha-1,2-mannosyltransferase
MSAALPRAAFGPEPAVTGWRTLWTPARARLWLAAAVIAAWITTLGVPARGWLDFSAFYAAGRLALTPDVTGLAPITAYQVAHGMPIAPFVYPAGLALPYALLSAAPYDIAAALHACLMLALLVAAAAIGATLVGLQRRWAILGALAWAPAAVGVATGQNSSLGLLLVVVSAAAMAHGREAAGGIAAGVLSYKPQLMAPLAGLYLLRGRWTALSGVVAMITVQWLAGVVATGGRLDWPLDWLATIRAYQDADLAANGWQAISLPGVAARLGLVLDMPWLVWVGYLAGGAIVLVCLPALRRSSWPEAIALAAACGLVLSPHAWIYDATLLLPAIGVFAARAARRGWPWRDRWWLAAAFAIASTWPLGGAVHVSAMPVLVVAMPFALLGRGPFRVAAAQAPVARPAPAPIGAAAVASSATRAK